MSRRRPQPRLIPLDEAKALLAGHHPILLGIAEALPGVFDRRAIHAALDRKAGLAVELPGQEPANDDAEEDELETLRKRIAARAARGA